MSPVHITSVTYQTHKFSEKSIAASELEPVHLLVVWIGDIKSVHSQDGEHSLSDLKFTIKDSLVAVQITAVSFKMFINICSKKFSNIYWMTPIWKPKTSL